MANKELRTVKKSGDTGRLNRDDVRSAVINARDNRSGQANGHASRSKQQNPGKGNQKCSDRGSARSNGKSH
jgi:hypothetical protein